MPRNYGTATLPPYATAPTPGPAGDAYWNTTLDQLAISDGSAWVAINPLSGWLSPGYSVAYASASTIIVSGVDWTGWLRPGAPIRLLQGTYSYWYVVSSSYSAPNTTATLVGPTGTETVTNAAITDWGFSPYSFPVDFPSVFTWTPTLVGFSANPTGIADNYFCTGGWLCYNVRHLTAGTSNAATYTMTMPIRARVLTNGQWYGSANGQDAGTNLTTSCGLMINSNNTILSAFKDMDFTTNKWTASGAKRITTGSIWYPLR